MGNKLVINDSKQSGSKKHELMSDRFVKILIKLNHGEKVSIQNLAEEMQCSTRTISRDLVKFESLLNLRRGDGYYWLEQKYVGMLTPKDIENFAQISGLEKLYPKLSTSFIRELLDARASDTITAKGYDYENAEQFLPLFAFFKPAIQSCYEVSFLYNGTPRTVQPYKIVHYQGSWYLAAVREHELRAYRLSRIKLLESCENGAVFKPDADILNQLEDESSIWFGLDKMEVVVSVDAEMEMYFRQREILPEQKVLGKDAEGRLLLSSTVIHKNQILPLVRYWIPHIKIVSPESLKQQLKLNLNTYMEMV